MFTKKDLIEKLKEDFNEYKAKILLDMSKEQLFRNALKIQTAKTIYSYLCYDSVVFGQQDLEIFTSMPNIIEEILRYINKNRCWTIDIEEMSEIVFDAIYDYRDTYLE